MCCVVLVGCSTSYSMPVDSGPMATPEEDATRPPADDGGDSAIEDAEALDTDMTAAPDGSIGGDGGLPDASSSGPPECEPGTQRWCSPRFYDSWGKQTCRPDGRWGACIEPTVDEHGLADRPATDCGCRFIYFYHMCCEDQEDRDGDGYADCLIPADHTSPECSSDGTLCSYCDVALECGGETDLCLFSRDGYGFCGRDCESEPCPTGFECMPITTREATFQQCVPVSETCD
jgi:hypothetical protein